MCSGGSLKEKPPEQIPSLTNSQNLKKQMLQNASSTAYLLLVGKTLQGAICCINL